MAEWLLSTVRRATHLSRDTTQKPRSIAACVIPTKEESGLVCEGEIPPSSE
jgi:hypothetical protein